MMLRHSAWILVFSLLAGCSGTPEPGAVATRQISAAHLSLPPMRRFGSQPPIASYRSNSEIAQNFLDLHFQLENGRTLEAFSRFSGPITVRMIGPMPATAGPDLAALLTRLRGEAGLDIRQTSAEDASVTIEFMPRRKLQGAMRDAACFVVPRVGSFAEYRRASRATLDWTDYPDRQRAAIFIPNDTSPQEVRDCLHEELAQAIGPLNDLYQLPDSVFNDDNMAGVLTGFDMVILRATYARDLQPGMRREEVALRLPGLLARINPAGNRPGGGAAPTPRAYSDAIARALGPTGSGASRRAAAREAVEISAPWQDGRTGFALLAAGHVSDPANPKAARDAFAKASAVFARSGLPIHQAHADLQLAMFALANGQYEEAARLCQLSDGPAMQSQNASLLSGFMMIHAKALERLGQPDMAKRLLLDSLAWARYGFASEKDIQRRLALIEELASDRGAKAQ